jgi:hypothetical protein
VAKNTGKIKGREIAGELYMDGVQLSAKLTYALRRNFVQNGE